MAIRVETGPVPAPDPKSTGGEQRKVLTSVDLKKLIRPSPIDSSTVPEKPSEVQSTILFTTEKRLSIKETIRKKKRELKEKALIKEDQLMSGIEKKLSRITGKVPENQEPEKKLGFLERKFGKALDWLAAWEFLFLAEHQVIDNIQMIYPVGYERKLGEVMKDPDAILFTFSNHQSIAEIAAKAKLAQKNTKIINRARGFNDTLLGKIKRIFKAKDEKNRFRGNVVTYAKSLTPEGKRGQGTFAEQLALQAKNKLVKRNLFMEPFVRDVDKERFGLSRTDNGKLSSKLVTYIKTGFSFDYFTPGSVEESRFTDEEGAEKHRKGLQELDCTQYFRLMELAERLGKKIVILKVGMDGGYNIIDHTNRNKPSLTRKAIKACFDPRNSPGIRAVLKVLHSENKPLMTVKVGMPMKKEEVMRQIKEIYGEVNLKNVNNYMGHELAKLLSPEARGVYA